MKLRWPTRYEWTRGFFGILVVFHSYAAFVTDGDKSRYFGIVSAIYLSAYLIAGLLKPLHDDTGGRA